MDRRTFVIRLAATAVVGLIPLFTSVATIDGSGYGLLLFLGTPAVAGFLGSLVLNLESPPKLSTYLWVATLGTALYATGMMVWQLEGAICMIMALPLVLPAALGGAALGKVFGDRDERPVPPGAPILIFLR